MPQIEMELLEEMRRALVDASERLDAMARRMDRTLRESDRRRAAYLPILRRAGIVPGPPQRRARRWW